MLGPDTDTFSAAPFSGSLKLKNRKISTNMCFDFLLRKEALLCECCEMVHRLTWVQCGPGVQHCRFQAVVNRNLLQQWGWCHISTWGWCNGRRPGVWPGERGCPPHEHTWSSDLNHSAYSTSIDNGSHQQTSSTKVERQSSNSCDERVVFETAYYDVWGRFKDHRPVAVIMYTASRGQRLTR